MSNKESLREIEVKETTFKEVMGAFFGLRQKFDAKVLFFLSLDKRNPNIKIGDFTYYFNHRENNNEFRYYLAETQKIKETPEKIFFRRKKDSDEMEFRWQKDSQKEDISLSIFSNKEAKTINVVTIRRPNGFVNMGHDNFSPFNQRFELEANYDNKNPLIKISLDYTSSKTSTAISQFIYSPSKKEFQEEKNHGIKKPPLFKILDFIEKIQTNYFK